MNSTRSSELLLVVLCLIAGVLFAACAPGATGVDGGAAGGGAELGPREFMLGTIQFFCMALIVYFLLVINPAKAREENHKKFLKNLKKNDEVLTSSGIFARVISIKPEYITVDLGNNSKVRIQPEHLRPLPTGQSAAGGAGEKEDKSGAAKGGKEKANS